MIHFHAIAKANLAIMVILSSIFLMQFLIAPLPTNSSPNPDNDEIRTPMSKISSTSLTGPINDTQVFEKTFINLSETIHIIAGGNLSILHSTVVILNGSDGFKLEQGGVLYIENTTLKNGFRAIEGDDFFVGGRMDL